jgi:hypothetical protein
MSEAARADLYNGLSDLLGPERAETLMTHLPRYDPAEVATKSDFADLRSDFAELRSDFRTEMSDLRSDFGTEMSDLRSDFGTEMSDLRSDFGTEMSDLRSDFGTEMSDLRSDFGGEMSDLRGEMSAGFAGVNERFDRMYLTLVAGFFVVVAAMAGVVFTSL